MGLLSLVRDNPKTGDGGMPDRTDDVIGRLYMGGADFGIRTVENVRYLIPFGMFDVVRHDGERHQNVLKLVIPHYSNILIHRGSIPPHSKGCVLVPDEIEKWLRDNVLVNIDRGEKWHILIHEPPKAVL